MATRDLIHDGRTIPHQTEDANRIAVSRVAVSLWRLDGKSEAMGLGVGGSGSRLGVRVPTGLNSGLFCDLGWMRGLDLKVGENRR